MRRSFLLVFAWAPIACGGAPTSSLLSDGGSGMDAGGDTAMSDTGSNCNIAACATIPSGFTVVSLSTGTSACPSGWTSTDVVSAPVAGAGACTCSCNVTTPPDCSSGTIDRFIDDDTTPTCTEPASTLVATSSACTDSGFFIQFNHGHYAVDPPPPTGGTCAYNAQTDSTMVTSTEGLVCAPPTSCPGAVCGTGNVCVSQSGDVMCPSAFPQKTLVGTSATATCSACSASCAVTGTCTGTLAFYTYGDTTCATTPLDFTADGSCDANAATNEQTYYEYFEYTGTVASSSCMGQPPTSTATPTLNGPTTVCCQH